MGVLKREGAPGQVFLTGNTVVDALISVAREAGELPLDLSRDRMVLITGHRRENIGRRFQDAFEAIAALADRYPDVDFVYPVHMNPNVREHAHRVLAGRANVTLTEPVSYPSLIALMKRAYLILTDSGGIQEEAPSFGVPVLVMRETTERPEAVEAGVAKLVGTDRESIVANVTEWLDDTEKRKVISKIPNPFGDGHAADRIAGILTEDLRPAAVSNVAVG